MPHEQISRTIEVITPDLIELRRDLHAYPELSWHEERATDVVASWMDKNGIAHERFDSSGLVADIGPKEGPIIALRADLDALPVQDTTSDPWRSTVPGVAHSCGHDVHTAGLVGLDALDQMLHGLMLTEQAGRRNDPRHFRDDVDQPTIRPRPLRLRSGIMSR